MKYYLDITLLADAEANLGFLWQKVFQQVHIALVDNKVGDKESAIALSIPRYKLLKANEKTFPLGNKLRLLAETEEILRAININKWLETFMDYCHVKSITIVPKNVKSYARFTRKNAVDPIKKAEKRAKHLNKPLDEVIDFMRKEKQLEKCQLPFIHVESQGVTVSGEKNRFRIFIEQTHLDAPEPGKFDCYGLSKTATIPWF